MYSFFKLITHSKVSLFVFLIVLAALFFAISYYTPMQSDDFWYHCVTEKNGAYVFHTSNRIETFSELVQSVYNHRYVGNGRLADVFCYTLLYIGGGKGMVTSMVSTLVILLHLLIYSRLCFGKVSLIGCVVVLVSSIIFLPFLSGTVLWFSGSLNYLWGGVWLGLFLLLIKQCNQGKVWLTCAAIIALICGWWHEALGLCLGGAVFVLFCRDYWKHKKVSVSYVIIGACLAMGLLVVLSAPAIWDRALNEVNEEVSGLFERVALPYMKLFARCAPGLIIFAIVVLVNRFKNLNNFTTYFIIGNILLIGAFGGAGAWGGAFYYLCIGMMVWTLSTLKDKIEHFSVTSCVTCLVMSLACVSYGVISMKEIHDIFGPLQKNPPMEEPVSIDITEIPQCTWWYTERSSPFSSCGGADCYYGKKCAPIVFNSMVKDKSVYNCFDDKLTNEIQLARMGERIVMRFAKNTRPIRLVACYSDNPHAAPCVFAYETVTDKMLLIQWQFLQGKKIVMYSLDYHDGFFYAMMELPPEGYQTVEISVLKDENQQVVIKSVIP